jgi:hypothetical protein
MIDLTQDQGGHEREHDGLSSTPGVLSFTNSESSHAALVAEMLRWKDCARLLYDSINDLDVAQRTNLHFVAMKCYEGLVK